VGPTQCRYIRSDDLDDETRNWVAEYTVERVGLDGGLVFDLRDLCPDLDEVD
jgi:hypothetical protein